MSAIGRLGTFGLSATASLAVAVDAYSETIHAGYVAVALVAVMALHIVRFPRIAVVREAVLYALFVGYMLIQLLWTGDRGLAMNTIVPAGNVLILLLLYASLMAMHDTRAVLGGALAGFAAGAAGYTIATGFPFRYPANFSYNAVAGLYLFGLLVTLLFAAIERRKALLVVLAALVWAHVVATTSIKTNVGILFGATVAAAAHFGYVWRSVWRHALGMLALAGVLAFAVASNEAAVQSLRRGADRVALGLDILQAREELPGYSAFDKRTSWQREGLRGWAGNPVFGHGVEAFRADFGITSHASHVDLLYNSGLIGFALFYGVLLSVMHRLYRARRAGLRDARLVILGGVVCFFVISFAGTIHYLATVGAFLGLAIGMLKRA